MNLDLSTLILTFTPVYEDITTGYELLNITYHDEYYPTTAESYYEAYIFVHPNRVPRINESIPDQTQVAGLAYSYTFSATLFIEEDGETLTYSLSTSPSQTWLSLDNSTKTLSGTPIPNGDAQNYTITVTADDTYSGSASSSVNFYLNVTENQIPMFDQGLPAASDVIVYFPFSYTVPIDAFLDPEGEIYSFRYELIPNNFTLNYDPGTRTFSGTQNDNTKYGLYTLKFYVEDVWNVTSFTPNVTFNVIRNEPPVVDTPIDNPACIVAHYFFFHTIPKSYFSEPDGEPIYYSFVTNETSIDSWLSMSENSTHVIFSGTPDNTQKGNYTVSLQLKDNLAATTHTNANFIVCINENKSPYLVVSPPIPTNGEVGFSWRYEFEKVWMDEYESEALTFSCSISPTDPWIN
jgi:hypothetical protein